ncbi:uncharacterized protein LOC122847852, partial [Aphidius gifuensis]|uniref:uncharacterized protein LOC122847852 n=1 Tax=Aphidius gifuensis TaxID=684658 RepID=UPI001CDB6861
MRNHKNVISKVLGLLVIFGLSVEVSLSKSRNQRFINRKIKLTKNEDVGTVLFDTDDFEKTCWNDDELILILSKTVFQNMLPEANTLDYDHDEYIDHFMEYVNKCQEQVQQLAQKKLKHLVSKAFADTIGGYLRVYILPNTKRSYYAGNIDFQKAKKLFDLYDEFKIFLRTNGEGWNKPIESNTHMNIKKIDVTFGQDKNHCDGLILYHDADGSVSVPMPILDDSQHPTSIALPFESDNLCSLFSEKSAFIIVKYFTTGSKCLASSSSAKMELERFEKQLHQWIEKSVNPHLHEETWYPAFGGILKIIVTLEAKGHNSNLPIPRHNVNYQVLPNNFEGHKKHLKNPTENNEKCGINEFLIVVIVCILLIWLLLGIIFVTCRLLKNNTCEDVSDSHDHQGNYKIDDLYENAKYPLHENSSNCEGGLLKKLT